MNNPDEILQFKQLLDKLPYLSAGEKMVACSLFTAGDESARLEMVSFYNQQITEHKSLLDKYFEEIELARQDFTEKIKSLAAQI